MKVLIIGLPKSGTTALYNNLCKSYPTECISYFEPSRKSDFSSCVKNMASEKCIVVKEIFDNSFDYSIYNFVDKVILIIRDPRDRLISKFLFIHGHRSINNYNNIQSLCSKLYNQLKQKRLDPTIPFINLIHSPSFEDLIYSIYGSKFDSFSKIDIHEQLKFIEFINRKNTFIFKYESMIDKNFNQLENYLGFKIISYENVPTTHLRVARTKSYGSWKNWFTPTDIDRIDHHYDPILNIYNYNNDWSLNNKQHIEEDHCDGYVTNLWNTWTFLHHKYNFTPD